MLFGRKSTNEIPQVNNAAFDVEMYEKRIAKANARIESLQKELAETRAELAKAQEENLAKTQFLSTMSHDIRTPMNAITGFTRLAKKHIGNKELIKDYLDKISGSSDHLLMLINDVLDISRIESGTMKISDAPEDISDIVHGLGDLVRQSAAVKGLDFSMEAYDIVHEDILCDKLHLNEVLLNQLSNAIKYTPSGSVVFIVKELAQKKPGYGEYEFRIKDTGIGMSKEFLKNIYKPFSRSAEASRLGIQGTGLGMAITAKLVELMHGTIAIDSEPDKGTEVMINFSFRLAAENAGIVDLPATAGIRALICSSNWEACRYIAGILDRNGFSTEWCLTGKEASIRTLEAAQDRNQFGLFLVDWNLPGEKNTEILANIRSIAGEKVPVVVMADIDTELVQKKLRGISVDAIVGKPLFPSDLNDFLAGIGKNVPGRSEDSAMPEMSFSGRHILIAEDNELNMEIATDVLEEYGLIVTPAVNGAVALEKLRAAKPGDYDLVLMDIQMPVMDGYKATEAIRVLDSPVSRIPIVAMTANAFAEDRQAALDAGMDDHMTKPIEIEVLNNILSRFIK